MLDFRISRDALTDPHDAERVWWDVITRVFDELRLPYEPDPRHRTLTPGQRALYALHWTRSEVENGGFHQFLYNPTGLLANDALLGARLIGATEFAVLFWELRSLLSDGGFDEDQAQRVASLGDLSDDALARLEGLTERFYVLMSGDEKSGEASVLAAYCAKYVDAHPEEFFLPPAALT